MTKKDYILLSKAIKSTLILNNKEKASNVFQVQMVEAITEELQKDNIKFNRERFLQACGLTN